MYRTAMGKAIHQWEPPRHFAEGLAEFLAFDRGRGGKGDICGECSTELNDLSVGCFGGSDCAARYCNRECRARAAAVASGAMDCV